MGKIIKACGSFFVTLTMYSVQICLTLAVVYDWHGFLKVLLTIASAVQFWTIARLIYERSEDEAN